MKQLISFKLNGENVSVQVNGDETLLTIIRTYLDKTGTKYGCGIGQCGACTVLIDKEAIRACMVLVEDVKDQDNITIEGLQLKTGELHPIQQAFIEIDALEALGKDTPEFLKPNRSILM